MKPPMPAPEEEPSPEELLDLLDRAIEQGETDDAYDLACRLQQRLFEVREQGTPLVELETAVEERLRILQSAEYLKRTSREVVAIERGDDAEGVVYPVWFGTNRKADSDKGGFTSERAAETALGRVNVFVPQGHRFGQTGSSFLQRLLRFDLRDDTLRLQSVETLNGESFFQEVNRAVADAEKTDGESHAFVYLHGYNTDFEEAAIRAAQIGYDLNVLGPTAFFSWPSQGTFLGYPADEACIEASEEAITEFLIDFSQRCGAEKIHLLAHSMGNRGSLRSVQRIAADAERRGKVRFGQIFLAAPDVDSALFESVAKAYTQQADRVTLYTSRADLPVYLSSVIHRAPRAGFFKPYTLVPGIDTVAVPNFNVELLGHSYFAKASAMLHDLRDLMLYDQPPRGRQQIEPLNDDGHSLWRFRR